MSASHIFRLCNTKDVVCLYYKSGVSCFVYTLDEDADVVANGSSKFKISPRFVKWDIGLSGLPEPPAAVLKKLQFLAASSTLSDLFEDLVLSFLVGLEIDNRIASHTVAAAVEPEVEVVVPAPAPVFRSAPAAVPVASPVFRLPVPEPRASPVFRAAVASPSPSPATEETLYVWLGKGLKIHTRHCQYVRNRLSEVSLYPNKTYTADQLCLTCCNTKLPLLTLADFA